MNMFLEFLRRHKWSCILCVIGIVIAVLMLTIGFWRTLLITVVIGLCFAVGFVLDTEGPGGFARIFRQITGKDKK